MKILRKRTIYDWVIEILSFLALVCSLIPLFFYSQIKDGHPIPTHYNILGQADKWGEPYYLLIFSFLSLTLYLLLSILERNYKFLNLPVKITPNNESIIGRLSIRLLRHLKLFLALIFAYLNTTTFIAATGKVTAGVNNFIMFALLGGFLITVIYFSVKMRKYR